MVAFSCCTYDGGDKEKREMDNARERSWRGKFRRPGRKISPEINRVGGKCPLTPLEVRSTRYLLSISKLCKLAAIMIIYNYFCWINIYFDSRVSLY